MDINGREHIMVLTLMGMDMLCRLTTTRTCITVQLLPHPTGGPIRFTEPTNSK